MPKARGAARADSRPASPSLPKQQQNGSSHQTDQAHEECEIREDNSAAPFQPPLRPLLRRILHWGPLLAMTVVGQIATATINSHLAWWPPEKSVAAIANLSLFVLFTYFVLSYLVDAAYWGPGYVPLSWRPENPEHENYLQYCSVCQGFKAPRSHHCRKCNRCVMKMDHHCPWINNCVGFANQGSFTKFLLSAVIGCSHAVLILGPSIYRAIFRDHYQVWYLFYGTGEEPIVDLGIYSIIYAIFAFGLAVGVIVSVGFLFGVQIRSILRNKTGIEDYIVAKAECRKSKTPFVYPYDVGRKENFVQVLNWSGVPKGDGFWYPVVEGCDQFTLSVEQKRQKQVKRRHAVEYIAARSFSGRICTCWHGIRTFCCQPWSDEPKISIIPGEIYLVTRWHKYWLYGDRVEAVSESASGDGVVPCDANQLRKRGWFPRSCVRRMEDIDAGADIDSDTKKHK